MKKRRNRGKNGKTVGNGSISRPAIATYICDMAAAGVVVAVSLTVGACALWLPDRAPALLAPPRRSRARRPECRSTREPPRSPMIPTVSQTRELVGNAPAQ